MTQLHDLAGQQFGRWTVLERDLTRVDKPPYSFWICICIDGKKGSVSSANLISGASQSCGCLRYERQCAKGHTPFIDLTGQIFTHLEVIERAPSIDSASGGAKWLCRCLGIDKYCGTEIVVSSYELRHGGKKACKQCSKERLSNIRTLHGDVNSDEYDIWCDMNQRCNNTRHPSWKDYGGRGITVCPEWRSYPVFRNDVGPRPSKNHSLERLNNSLGYFKENVIWATQDVQARNTRRNHFVTFNDITKCLKDWCIELKIPHTTLSKYLKISNDDLLLALTNLSNISKYKDIVTNLHQFAMKHQESSNQH